MDHGERIDAEIRDALRARERARAAGVELHSWLATQRGEQDARAILETLRAIEANHRAIEASPHGREVWLTGVIEDARDQLARDGEIAVPPLTSPGPALSATRAREIQTGIVRSVAFGLEERPGESLDLEPSEEARAFFDRELGHAEDLETVATITCVVLPYVRKSASEGAPIDARSVAAAVDLGATAAKAAYHAATDRIDPPTALSWCLDRAAAAAGEVVSRAVAELAEEGAAAIGTFLGELVGMAPAGAHVGRILGRMAGEAVARPIAVGVELLVRSIPQIATKAYEGVNATAQRVLSALGW